MHKIVTDPRGQVTMKVNKVKHDYKYVMNKHA
jgi:hypothetical protein